MRNKLKEWRKRVCTQQDVADQVGCTLHAINRIENGHSVSVRMALQISAAIGYQIDPSGRIQAGFERMGNVSIVSVKHAAQVFEIEFDPENLF